MRPLLTALALSAAALTTAGAASAQEGPLVLYTSQPNADAQATVDAFMAAYPQVEVEWVRDGTTKIMARLRAEFEADAPQPDVLFIADMVTMEGLKREGRLMAHPEADVSAYPAGLHDPEGYYFSTKLITSGIVYNTASDAAPATWADLVEGPCAGKVAMPSPLTSGAATIHMATLTANPELGWDYYAKLAETGAVAQGGNGGTLKAVAGGEKLCGVVVDFLPIREAAKGAPVAFVFPPQGVSAVTEPAAILSTAKNPDAAKAFIDFLVSREGQELAARMGYLPAHPDVTPPEGFPARAEIKLMDFDPADALENDAAHKAKFNALFGG
ncbi:iron(III) transport system substrate-binding protein [Albimonas donghaensis]|uniref:Iron(III) transport system substrate-binding protein n=1 Tax=Albimonas donghaensis TaxID=356660 RepID=A0A1H2QIW1_9RHOB|nr:ABC transporter substrate-binding protein [Albimonas donghaensis]SDW06850.1 iron(III) transport system substrate-binding protein [Albimonas donghaensis]